MQIDLDQWSVLSRLLDEAFEVPMRDLERWLRALPAADAVHRPRLRELLEQRAVIETGDFLLTLPQVPPAPPGRSTAAFAPGTVIGPYTVEEEIGRGGMGTVWRARRSDKVIKRPAALKLPHTGLPSQELIERFTRERDILGELSHPNIARLDDAGVTESGQPFLALEYVPGLPLTDYCDDLGLDIRARLILYLQVLRAVQYAHSHLVIHRDLKPSNIIVTPLGRAMLVDFGIAKLIPDEGDDGIARTRLTPEYASPEQITGKPISTASDIYSLGVLLFELLTGERPYRANRTTRAALEEAIVHLEPLQPSEAVRSAAAARARASCVRKLSRALRGDLDAIVLKALEKSPWDRYATADALSRDIEDYLRGAPVSARTDGSWYRLCKLVRVGLAAMIRPPAAVPALLPAWAERAEIPGTARNRRAAGS